MAKIHKGVGVPTSDLQGGKDLRFEIEVDNRPSAAARTALAGSIRGLTGVRDCVFPSQGNVSLVLYVSLQRAQGGVEEMCDRVIRMLDRQGCFTEPPALPKPLF